MDRADQAKAARTVLDTVTDLRALAARADLRFLAYMLGLVQDEASATLKRIEGGGEVIPFRPEDKR